MNNVFFKLNEQCTNGRAEGRKEEVNRGKNGWDDGKGDVKVKVGENLPEQGAVMRLAWDFYFSRYSMYDHRYI